MSANDAAFDKWIKQGKIERERKKAIELLRKVDVLIHPHTLCVEIDDFLKRVDDAK